MKRREKFEKKPRKRQKDLLLSPNILSEASISTIDEFDSKNDAKNQSQSG